MAKLYNLARMTTATTGTGTITLGSAVASYLSFASSGVQNGETVTYAIVDGNNREIGRGVYTASGTTLTRTVLESTNSNTAINLSGNAEVFITAAAEDIGNVNETNTFTASQVIEVTDNSNAALRVTQLGTGAAIRVEDSANPDSTPFIVTATGFVGVGNASPGYILDVSGESRVGSALISTNPSTGSAVIELGGNRTGDGNSFIDFHSSAGTDHEARIIRGPGLNGNFNISNLGTGSFTIIQTNSAPISFQTNSLERFQIGTSGQLGIGGANYGTSGQVLTSGGASAAPTWSSPAAATGTLLRAPQILTSGTSYTTPAGCTRIYVEAVGGGAAGNTNGAGGGSGGYAARYFTVTESTAYTYAIGAGGTGSNGAAGGNTTFTVSGTTMTATGGSGVTGGTPTNGDVNIRGGNATTGSGTLTREGQAGAASFFGGGGGGGAGSGSTGGSGTNGVTGGGGGGAGSGTNSAGSRGSGGAGLIRIWEYA